MQIPRARAARVARAAKAAREVRVRLEDEVIGDGTADMLPSMGHAVACAYATVSKGLATDTIAVTILIERHRILRRDRVMGSYRLSGPRGFHV